MYFQAPVMVDKGNTPVPEVAAIIQEECLQMLVSLESAIQECHQHLQYLVIRDRVAVDQLPIARQDHH